MDSGFNVSIAVPESIAQQLGLDFVRETNLTGAFENQTKGKVYGGCRVEMVFDDEVRTVEAEVLTFGNTPLVGFLVLGALDLIIAPAQNKLEPRVKGGTVYMVL